MQYLDYARESIQGMKENFIKENWKFTLHQISIRDNKDYNYVLEVNNVNGTTTMDVSAQLAHTIISYVSYHNTVVAANQGKYRFKCGSLCKYDLPEKVAECLHPLYTSIGCKYPVTLFTGKNVDGCSSIALMEAMFIDSRKVLSELVHQVLREEKMSQAKKLELTATLRTVTSALDLVAQLDIDNRYTVLNILLYYINDIIITVAHDYGFITDNSFYNYFDECFIPYTVHTYYERENRVYGSIINHTISDYSEVNHE